MKWSEISIHTTQEAVEPVSHILHEAGAGGVVIEDRADFLRERENVYGEIYDLSADDYPDAGVLIKAYLPVNSFLGDAVEEIRQSVKQLKQYGIDAGSGSVSISEVDEEEWATAWKKYYKPAKIGSRITISPSWELYTPVRDEEIVVELDPGMAFGTGTHPTTVLCIQALEKETGDGIRMLDVGTGSGVLAIAAAKLGAAQVDAVDLDDVAVKSAEENVAINNEESRITVHHGNLLENAAEGYDLIAANILAEVITGMTHDAFRALRPGGKLIVSGIIETKRELVKDALLEAGLVIESITEMEDWVAITSRRPVEEN
ncbi:50S ribosomal protein L11 methyltransferase [Alkalicoccus urumqiensis]|uniref:Ribosomal protein L11 methyltransferase n=1 Tax=Alkalicoccus urumqiensis TaxID=1548213 RepID=A0A2P6MFM4_ALKUR|nr:50S ribosomal protein L11 methyltransferase [Alkalicoccus urumqiensis]PRO65095.1 50S ribosomal protein L11 methyltransferase [Alkalicoccus urumqiensis]